MTGGVIALLCVFVWIVGIFAVLWGLKRFTRLDDDPAIASAFFWPLSWLVILVGLGLMVGSVLMELGEDGRMKAAQKKLEAKKAAREAKLQAELDAAERRGYR